MEIYNTSRNLTAGQEEYFFSNLSAGTAQIKTGEGTLGGIIINSHTSGAIALYDGTTVASSVMHGTITFASGERSIDFGGERFKNGLFVNVGGTADITLRFK